MTPTAAEQKAYQLLEEEEKKKRSHRIYRTYKAKVRVRIYYYPMYCTFASTIHSRQIGAFFQLGDLITRR
jgi:hypothetical protein